MKFRKSYLVWRDPENKGFFHGPHARYRNLRDAQIFAAELIRRFGGVPKITVENIEIKSRKK